MHDLPDWAWLRLKQIIGDPKADPPIPPIVPISKSSWWAGVKSGRYPPPEKLGPHTTAWRVGKIRALKRPGSHVGRGDSAEQVVPQVQRNHSTTSQPLPCLDAVRASVKAAIVEAALAGAIDATRVPTALKLLSLEDA